MIAEPAAGNARVSLIAYATASAWAHYGFENAAWFDTRRGRALFRPLHASCRALHKLAPAPALFTETLYWRHRWFSAWIMSQAPCMALEIGAGLSTRGIAYSSRHPECRWVDYDLPGMVAARRRQLAGHALPNNYDLRSGNLLDPMLGAELRAPLEPRTCVMTEGVIDYLNHAEKRQALSRIATLLGRLGGGRYLFEIHPRDRLETFGAAGRVLLATLGRISNRDIASQLFPDPEAAMEMLADCGFARVRELDDDDLTDAADAPPAHYRAYTILEAQA